MAETKLNTEQAIINSSMARAYLSSSGVSLTANVESSAIPFDVENYDIGSDYNNSTGVFTAPVTGIYHFDASLQFLVTADQDGIETRIYLNTTMISRGSARSSGVAAEIVSISDNYAMTAGDTLEVRAINASSNDTVNNNQSATHFSVHLVART